MYTYLLATIFVSLVAAVPADLEKRQGVTAEISPAATAPSGCNVSYPSTFGIMAHNLSSTPELPAPTAVMLAIRQIMYGQRQTLTVQALNELPDGQAQAPKTTAAAVTQPSEGQPHAPRSTVVAISQISDGQIQAPIATAAPVVQLPKRQAQTATATSSTSTTDSFIFVACLTNSTLQLNLTAGVLKDSTGRTGYIAANYQFQFDDPPQAGAIYTAGYSVCSNGSLALGGSTVFYQCLSGSFYNIYNTDWAPQCSPISLLITELITC
jgi:hypothetical protein